MRSVGKIVHVSVDVAGMIALLSRSRARWARGMKHPDTGEPLTREEAIDRLLGMLAQGVLRLPIGAPCEGFSYETGCPGHLRFEGAGEAEGEVAP